MSISSKATGLRPGVCTSTTRPTAPYTGQIIYETDTGYLRVWDGAAWDYLSQKQDDTVGLGPTDGLVFIKSQAISNGVSSVTVSDVFSSTYTNYRIVFSRMYTTAGAAVRFQLSGYTGNNYYSAKSNLNTAGTASTDLQNGAAAYWIIGGADGGDANIFTMDISGPYTATRTGFTCTGFANANAFFAGGQLVDTTSNTGFTITLSANTFQGGTSEIRVYGYRNS